VFGCKCHFRDYSQNKSKFSPNTKEGIFLGFSEKYYSYIVMEIIGNKHKMHYTREIECEENNPAKYIYKDKYKFDPSLLQTHTT